MHKPSARHLGSQLTIAVLGAVVAIALTGGGFAFAQEAPEAGVGVAEALAGPNTVNSAAIVNGSVTGQDIATGTIGRGDLKPGSLPSWAKVAGSTTGTLLSGRGVAASSHVGTGVYQVDFTRSIVGCGWSATLNDNDAGAATAGLITVERAASDDVDSLFVRTFNTAGSSANTLGSEGFTVIVTC